MKITYDQLQPRDSVWIRTTVDKDGAWAIVIGQVVDVSRDSVMLDGCLTHSYNLSQGPTASQGDGVIWSVDRIDTIITLGS